MTVSVHCPVRKLPKILRNVLQTCNIHSAHDGFKYAVINFVACRPVLCMVPTTLSL